MALWVGYLLLPTLLGNSLGIRPPEYAVRVQRSVSFTTSDGTQLVADVFHPRRAGEKTPTILVRLPYSKDPAVMMFATTLGRMWAERGYTVVFQGTRGRYESGGTHYPMRDERGDGIETLEWLARQPWYDGRVGTWGGSYFGYTQWVVGDRSDPGPSSLMVVEASSDCHGMFYPGGAFSLQTALYWAVTSRGRENVVPSLDALARGYDGFPLLEADDRAVGDIAFFNDWASHPERDDHWVQVDGTNRAQRLKAPALLLGGWYDPFLPTQLNDYARIRKSADPRVAAETRLIVGPWAHAQTVEFPGGVTPRHFRLETLAPTVTWFDRHLLRPETPPLAPVRIYTMGTHRWRDEQEWPLARTQYTPYYLSSGGRANTSGGDGSLSRDAATVPQPADTFVYDPRNPVPTAGGAMLGPDAGTRPQASVESRPDVLVYTTEPLPDDLEVTGPVSLVLHVSTTATCTDFTGKLVDVYPDGTAFNVSDGILRRRYEKSVGESPATEITIDLWPTSTVFLKGHRIRLEVSSSNYPRFDRNPNTGRAVATERHPLTAMQTIWHGPTTPSRLILPVIPKP
ncbi:MAG: hydrolase [Planctomycetaceae bacterium]|nr:hydrolase [Planctomycetaceae bacterium]